MFCLTRLRALTHYILCFFSIYPYYGYITTCQFLCIVLIWLYCIYMFIDTVLNWFCPILHTMFFDIRLIWIYHQLSVYMYSLNMTMLFIYIHRHSLNMTLSVGTYYVIIFLGQHLKWFVILACGINFSNYVCFTQREVFNIIQFYIIQYVVQTFLWCNSPLFINLKNI